MRRETLLQRIGTIFRRGDASEDVLFLVVLVFKNELRTFSSNTTITKMKDQTYYLWNGRPYLLSLN